MTPTVTLFTLLALFLSLFTISGALPTTAPVVAPRVILIKAPVQAIGPRSLLGRYYLRYNLAAAVATPNTPSKPAPLPADGSDFPGRADRFQVLQRRRAARAVKVPVHRAPEEEDSAWFGDKNNLLSNHTIAASPAPAAAARVSTQVQAPRPAHRRTGTLKHHGLKKAVAAKQVALL